MHLLDKTLFRVYVTGMDKLIEDSPAPVEQRPHLADPEPQPLPVNPDASTDVIHTFSIPIHTDDTALMSMDEAVKRHRGVEGMFAKKKLEPTEQLIHAMSRPAAEGTRSLQKTQEQSKGSTNKPSEHDELSPFIASFLSSPNISVEARMRKIGVEGFPKSPEPSEQKFSLPSVQWKTTKNVDGIFDETTKTNLKKDTDCGSVLQPQTDLSQPTEAIKASVSEIAESFASSISLIEIPEVLEIPDVPEIAPFFQVELPPDLTADTVEETDKTEIVVEPVCIPKTNDDEICDESNESKINVLAFTQPKRLSIRPESVVAHWPHSCEKMKLKAADQIRCLVDHIETKIRDGCNSVVICGNSPGCGCSTIMLCCSREIANRGWKTLMMDAHFENPSLGEFLKIPVENGWESVFLPNRTESSLLFSLDKNLDILPLARKSALDARQILLESGLKLDCFQNIMHRYKIVLIDSGSLQNNQTDGFEEKMYEISRLNPDGLLLILGGDKNNRNNLLQIDQRLRIHGLVQIGIAENYF